MNAGEECHAYGQGPLLSAGRTASRHRSFTLILGGGGARGFAHVGVLRALEGAGWLPSAVVGVSMGAIVGAAYALRADWYRALRDTSLFGLTEIKGLGPTARRPASLRRIASRAKTMWNLGHGWGTGLAVVKSGRDVLRSLFADADLSDGRVPVAVCATDLLSGERVVIRTGPAEAAVYASSALAGILPPVRRGPRLLADGAYTDICPIDVARTYGNDVIVAVNPGRADVVNEISTGLAAIMRATEICYLHHAALRFAQADVVIRPSFRRPIDTLDFAARRECVAAGIRGLRACREELEHLLLGR